MKYMIDIVGNYQEHLYIEQETYFSKCIYQHYTCGTTVKKFRFCQDGVTIGQEFTFLCSIMLQIFSWLNEICVSSV